MRNLQIIDARPLKFNRFSFRYLENWGWREGLASHNAQSQMWVPAGVPATPLLSQHAEANLRAPDDSNDELGGGGTAPDDLFKQYRVVTAYGQRD